MQSSPPPASASAAFQSNPKTWRSSGFTSWPSLSPPCRAHLLATPANQKSLHRESCTSRTAPAPASDPLPRAPLQFHKTLLHPPADSLSARPCPPDTPAESIPTPDSSPPSRRSLSPHESLPAE